LSPILSVDSFTDTVNNYFNCASYGDILQKAAMWGHP